MDRQFQPVGKIYQGEGAVVRMALMSAETRELIERSDVLTGTVTLRRLSPDPAVVNTWGVNVDSALNDGPVFHAQDPGWPHTRQGYNFKWHLPSGFTGVAPARYRVVVQLRLTGSRMATCVADLEVEAV